MKWESADLQTLSAEKEETKRVGQKEAKLERQILANIGSESRCSTRRD